MLDRVRAARSVAAVVLAMMMAPILVGQLGAQRPTIAACTGGGTGHVRVAPRVDAVFIYERCLGADRIASIVLWRARAPGWSADPDAVAFDQQARALVVTARDGAHPVTLGRTDSVMVVMLDYADAVAGPIPLQTTRLGPARAVGIAPPAAGGPAPRDVSDSLRALLVRDGRSRRFLER